MSIYIIAHKQVFMPNLDGYYPILVGAYNNKANYSIKDNIGQNISKKNSSYCELTGLYWLWKNTNDSFVGIVHYRRFFTNSKLSCNENRFLKKEEIQEILKHYDVILPIKRYYKKNVKDSLNIAPNVKDMEEIRRVLKLKYPDYIEDFNKFMEGHYSYLYNMMIMKREFLDNYCKWLFDILHEIEVNHDMTNESAYRQRLYGFLSERLLTVWIMHNIPENKIKEIRVVKIDESSFTNIKHDIRNFLRKFHI